MHKSALKQDIEFAYIDLMAAYNCCLIEIDEYYKTRGVRIRVIYNFLRRSFAISFAQSRIVKRLDGLKDNFTLLAAAERHSEKDSDKFAGYIKNSNEVIDELSKSALMRFSSPAALFTGVIAAIPLISFIVENMDTFADLIYDAGNFDFSFGATFWLVATGSFIYAIIYTLFLAAFYGKKQWAPRLKKMMF